MSEMIKAIDEQGVSVKNYWKSYNILSAIRNIGTSWAEIKNTTMNRSWKKLCLQFVSSDEDMTENEDQIIDEVVEMGRRLELNMDNEDVIDLIEAHSEELTASDLIQLQEQVATEIDHEDQIQENLFPKDMKLQTIGEILSKVEDIVEVVENFDPDTERRINVISSLRDATLCYKTMYQEMKKKQNTINYG